MSTARAPHRLVPDRASGILFLCGAVGIPVAMLVLGYAAIAAPPPCATDGGCTPTPWIPVALGLAVAVPFTILLHPWVTAILGLGVGMAWWQADRSAVPSRWSLGWALAFAAMTLIIATAIQLRRRRLNPPDDSWPASAPARWHARPPEPPRRRWVARRMAAVAAALVVGAGAMAAWAWYAQSGADERRTSARVVSGTVTDSDGGRVTASLDDQTVAVVTVLDSTPYAIGSRQQFHRPASGPATLVREPENHTGWLFWSALVGALGLMLAVRVASHNWAVRRLFSREQPVRAVRFVDDGAGVHVLLDSGGHGATPTVEAYLLRFPVSPTMPYRPGSLGVRPMWPIDYPTAQTLAEAQPAKLYGEPTHWQWCALVTGSQALVPHAPAELMVWEPAEHGDEDEDEDEADPRDDADDAGPLTAPAAPGATSFAAAASTHRTSHVRFYLYAAGAGLLAGAVLAALMFSAVARFDLGLALLALWTAVGVGIASIWRSRMASRAAWNDGSVSVAVSDGVHHLPWRDVVGIETGVGKVVLQTRDQSFDVYARDSVRRWPVAGERTTAALAAALHESWRRALATEAAYSPQPPPLVYPIRPMLLWALWIGETAVLFAALKLLPFP